MDLLTAVNLILPKLGEHPVTRVEDNHPTIAVLLPVLEDTLRKTLLPGFWFNTFPTTLYPSSENEIVVPVDALSFIPTDNLGIMRGGRLFNPETLNYVWTKPAKGVLRMYVPFDECPESCARYVLYSSCVQAYATDIGVEDELNLWQALAESAKADLQQEHLRNMKYTTQKSYRYQRIRNALRA